MANALVEKLNLTQEEKGRLDKLLHRIKSIAEFFSDAVDAVKDTDYPAAIAEAAPWAGVVSESIAEAVPPIKFAVKLFEGLTTQHDPEVLGHLACSLAYQRAAQRAIEAIGVPSGSKSVTREVRKTLKALERLEDVDLRDSHLAALSNMSLCKRRIVYCSSMHTQ